MLHWEGKQRKPEKSAEFYLSDVFSPNFKKHTDSDADIELLMSDSPIFYNTSERNDNILHEFQQSNLLFEGDNFQVLQKLTKKMKGMIDLIYIDPPFMKNTSFYRQIALRGLEKDVIYKQKQFTDTWNLAEYLQFLYERIILLKDILRDTGSIYIHLDEDAAHYVKVIMDEVFGRENFRRQIIWNTASLNVAGFKGEVRDNYIYATGIILFYTKSDNYTFNPQFKQHSEEFIAKKYKKSDDHGRYRITRRKNKIYLHDDPGEPYTNIWNDILSFNYAKAASQESVFYPTQKPEGLLERIIKASSNPGDVILDCFSGSGTTASVAQKLDRKWIACDSNTIAIHISSKRLQRLLSPEFSSKNIRSFQIWKEKILEPLNNPIKLVMDRNGDYVTIEIVEVNEIQIYENAKVKQKKIEPPPFALLDSVFISFSPESESSQPFIVEFSDIPRGRKESIKGKYTFFLPDRMENSQVANVRVYDIFGNCYNSRLELRNISDSDLD